MSKGNFSNNGRDTFDPLKQYIGIRLQQGVPLLDRDWNELEDIRRHFERLLRRDYIGPGVPDAESFRISAPPFHAPGDFLIAPGRCLVDGYDVTNFAPLLYSEQPGCSPLPRATRDEVYTAYLQAEIVRVTSDEDPNLLNAQDINVETCVRDKLIWTVRLAVHPEQPPAGTYPLAIIRRPAGSEIITDDMIEDIRRPPLHLGTTVDELARTMQRVERLEARLSDVQLDIENVKEQLSRLFWDVRLSVSRSDAYFGGKVDVTATVTDGMGDPVSGAELSFSSDWGAVHPATAVTDRNGKASVTLVGVYAETAPSPSEIGLLQEVVRKVERATLSNPGSIRYTEIRFEPQEMALVSRYLPPAHLADLATNLPAAPIVTIPPTRTSTLTVHAKENRGTIVRGVGTIQVRFGLWVRDWAKSKVVEVIGNVHVSARIGGLMEKGFLKDGRFQFQEVNQYLPETLQEIEDDTQRTFKRAVLTRADANDAELINAGVLGQAIAQEATAAIGLKTNEAIVQRLDQFVAEPEPERRIDANSARVAKTHLVQTSSIITAGFTQNKKQLFTGARVGM